MEKSADAQVLLLLCSHLGLPPGSDPAPLTLRDWNPLARKIEESGLEGPNALLGMGTEDLLKKLDIEEALAERIVRLLDRGGALAIELERLESLGIWTVTRTDESYPSRFRERLKDAAPLVLFGAGKQSLIGRKGLAIVGSRDAADTAKQAAEFAGEACAQAGLVVCSGGARGVDGLAMVAALQAEGQAVGVLADSLEKAIRGAEIRDYLERGDLVLLTPYHPKAGFSVGTAMGRNKLIYTLADYALVVSSDAESGGTWAGAKEALDKRWVPVFVCDGEGFPEGNRLLLKRGASPFPFPFGKQPSELADWLDAQTQQAKDLTQPTLFSPD
jgi:predicted Rossmann fold nucleotide-binding protein DprA/Smf involved in DNA uptake